MRALVLRIVEQKWFKIVITLVAVGYLILRGGKPLLDCSRGDCWGVCDFAGYYSAAVALRTGYDVYDFDIEDTFWEAWVARDPDVAAMPRMTYLHPPLLAVALVPLSFLPFELAALLWLLASLVAFVASVTLLAKHFQVSVSLLMPLLVLLTPFGFNMVVGNADCFVVVCLVVYVTYSDDRPLLAALSLALAIHLLVIPACALIVLAWRRRWRAFGQLVVTCLLLLVITGLLTGSSVYASFFQKRIGTLVVGLASGDFSQDFSDGTGDPVGWSVRVPRLLLLVLAVTTLGLTWQGQFNSTLELMMWLAIGLLATPYPWNHLFGLMLPFFAWAVMGWVKSKTSRLSMVLAVLSAFLIDTHYLSMWLTYQAPILNLKWLYGTGRLAALTIWLGISAELIGRLLCGRRQAAHIPS